MKQSLERIGRSVKTKVEYYQRVYRHPDTPWPAKALLWIALAYTLSPIDLIPDFIPVIGHLDDLLIVPGLIILALWLIPEKVKTECQAELPAASE